MYDAAIIANESYLKYKLNIFSMPKQEVEIVEYLAGMLAKICRAVSCFQIGKGLCTFKVLKLLA